MFNRSFGDEGNAQVFELGNLVDVRLVVVAEGKVREYRKETDKTYAATIYTASKGNVVFNAATCWWSMLLSTPPGFVSPPGEDFARSDPRVQRITENLFARVLRSGPPGP